MSLEQDHPKTNPVPKVILPGQAYMARSSKNRWPEPHHWLTGHQNSPSSEVQQDSPTQLSSQAHRSFPHPLPADSKDPEQPHQGSQATLDRSGDGYPVEDEYLKLNEVLTPSAANKEPESSHPIRQRRKAAERDPWTTSLEKTGGVDYYGSAASVSAPSRPSNSPASSHASVCRDTEEKPSQKQPSGLRSAQGPAKDGTKRSNKAGDCSRQRAKPALDDSHEGETDDYVFLM